MNSIFIHSELLQAQNYQVSGFLLPLHTDE